MVWSAVRWHCQRKICHTGHQSRGWGVGSSVNRYGDRTHQLVNLTLGYTMELCGGKLAWKNKRLHISPLLFSNETSVPALFNHMYFRWHTHNVLMRTQVARINKNASKLIAIEAVFKISSACSSPGVYATNGHVSSQRPEALLNTSGSLQGNEGGGIGWMLKMTQKQIFRTQKFGAAWSNFCSAVSKATVHISYIEKTLIRLTALILN